MTTPAELRALDLKMCAELAQKLKPVGDWDPRETWQALLGWLEADESRVLPRTREEVLAAQEDGYPDAERDLLFLRVRELTDGL